MLLLLLLEEVSLNTKLGLCILPEEGLQLCLWCGHLLGSPKVHEGPGCQRLARGWQLSWHKVRGPQVRGTCRWGATGSGQEGGRGLVAGVGNSHPKVLWRLLRRCWRNLCYARIEGHGHCGRPHGLWGSPVRWVLQVRHRRSVVARITSVVLERLWLVVPGNMLNFFLAMVVVLRQQCVIVGWPPSNVIIG